MELTAGAIFFPSWVLQQPWPGLACLIGLPYVYIAYQRFHHRRQDKLFRVVSENAANRSLTIARRRLELGDINYLLVLTAQQTYLQALLVRVQAQANRFADTVALFQALGGGWWNRNDLDPPKQYPFFNLTD